MIEDLGIPDGNGEGPRQVHGLQGQCAPRLALGSLGGLERLGLLQRRQHLHLAELRDGEVQVLDRLIALVGIVVKQQLGELEAYERYLRPVADLARGFQGLVVVGPCLVGLAD